MFLQRLLKYLNPATAFRKGDDQERPNINLRMMHGINRISIFMFIICLGIMFYRLFIR
jgi:hypothetical protein